MQIIWIVLGLLLSSPTGKKFLAQFGNLNKTLMKKITPKFNAILKKRQEVEH